MLDTGYFMKIAKKKIIPNKKNQSVLIANISYAKRKLNRQSPKINSRQNSVPHGIQMRLF